MIKEILKKVTAAVLSASLLTAALPYIGVSVFAENNAGKVRVSPAPAEKGLRSRVFSGTREGRASRGISGTIGNCYVSCPTRQP